mmetsp:Transcript_13132/g.35378  ORF Transcript_13132/g.35378 Transcript_13132/m.35378 type:complete len:127 (-) Transcript_13132:45-425(-)
MLVQKVVEQLERRSVGRAARGALEEDARIAQTLAVQTAVVVREIRVRRACGRAMNATKREELEVFREHVVQQIASVRRGVLARSARVRGLRKLTAFASRRDMSSQHLIFRRQRAAVYDLARIVSLR